MVYLFIFVLSGVGALLRFFLSVKFNASGFPWGTLSVNVIGSVALGCFVFFASQKHYFISKDMHLAMCVGLFGGLTTFSTFSFELFDMIQNHKLLMAGSYVMASVVGSLLLVFISFGVLQRTFS
ncbi:MAG: CrcB family protein [Bdellovibrionales bacterium]|nr:CrcB family protein [Bdellovibrionales bacterium]